MLVRRLREDGREVVLPFRCDSPELRREMDLQIGARAAGRFVVFSARLRAEERRPEPQPLLSAEAERGAGTLTMCGWCDRFLVAGEWVEVDEAASRLSLFGRDRLPEISHGVCPECGKLLLAA